FHGRSLPGWAAELDAKTWAQFFLKFVVSHPSITAATPATSQAKNMIDNIGGGIGRMPDEPTRKRMVAFVDALPSVGWEESECGGAWTFIPNLGFGRCSQRP